VGKSRIQKIVEPLKIVATIEVQIDMAAWTQNYGVAGPLLIRRDVKAYIDNLVREHLREMGVIGNG
jgi:hypothetical protein